MVLCKICMSGQLGNFYLVYNRFETNTAKVRKSFFRIISNKVRVFLISEASKSV